MPAALPPRRLLLGLALLSAAAVFVAELQFERPGLGLSRFFFVSIALVALASGPVAGAAAGIVAAALYGIVVGVKPELPHELLWNASMAVRVVTYAGVGALVGMFAEQYRRLTAHLLLLADRDTLTGLPSGRAFETALSRRLFDRDPFAVLIGDVHSLGDSDDGLQRFASLAGSCLATDDVVARVGRGQFAIVTSDPTTDAAAQRAATLEAACSSGGVPLTFGWAVAPYDGDNGLALCRAADERLYARKLLRGVA